jgi:3-oxoacyl-[acyl-carrier-protein] synthase-1
MTDAQPLAISGTGIVSSVGLSAPAACAAIRAGVTNLSETRFADSRNGWIGAHLVPLERPWGGREKLARMASMVTRECLAGVPRDDWERIPLLLCVAEQSRPGRLAGLDDQLFHDLMRLSKASFSPESRIVAHGRVSIAVALMQARTLIYEGGAQSVLIVAADSMVYWPTLRALLDKGRLLTDENSNGFLPGEGSAGVLVCRPTDGPHLRVEGMGLAIEHAHIDSEEPLRAEGLSHAIKGALADARVELHELDFRIVDISGEHYYFKEASLALSRTMKERKEEFTIWHPAECIGEAGSVIGPTMLALGHAACVKRYAAGPRILIHAANDAGQRAAIVVRHWEH